MRSSPPSLAIGGRAVVVLLVLVALAAGVLALRHYAPQHLPTILRPPRAELAADAVAGPAAEANPPLYKWKDAKGQWHITDRPPQGLKYETVRVDPDTNVIPSFVPEQTETPTEEE